MTSEYRYNPETRVIESIPFDAKQTLPPTIENIMLLKNERAKFLIDGKDFSDIVYTRISKIYAHPHRHKEEVSWQSIRAIMSHNKKKSPDMSGNAIKLLKEGFAPETISSTLNVPLETVKKWDEHLKIPHLSTTPFKVGIKHGFTEDQKNDMRSFIRKNRSIMSNKEISKLLGVSVAFLYALMNPDRVKKFEQSRKFRESNGLVAHRKLTSKPTQRRKEKAMKPTIKTVPGISDSATPPKECRRCQQYQAEKTITENQLRQSIDMMDKVKDHYESQNRELRDDLAYFKNLINKVVK